MKCGIMEKFRAITALTLFCLSFVGLEPSSAETDARALETVAAIEPNLLFDGTSFDTDLGFESNARGSEKSGILFVDNKTGLRLSLSNPRSEKIVDFLGGDFRVLTSKDDIEFIPLTRLDGSVQTLAVIGSPLHKTYFELDIEVPISVSAQILESGEVLFTDANGDMVGGIARPWAMDSNGEAVDTWFELRNQKLIQNVAHKSGSFSYPIIADPWLGIDLYNNPTVTPDKKGYVINVTPTLWGGTFTGIGTWFAHRDEVVTKLGSRANRWTTTIQEQFYCHIAGFPASLPEYNLESWRPLVNWSLSLTAYRCNP